MPFAGRNKQADIHGISLPPSLVPSMRLSLLSVSLHTRRRLKARGSRQSDTTCRTSWCDRVGFGCLLSLLLLVFDVHEKKGRWQEARKIPVSQKMLLLREADATSHGENTRKARERGVPAPLPFPPLAPSLPPLRRIYCKGKGGKQSRRKERQNDMVTMEEEKARTWCRVGATAVVLVLQRKVRREMQK